MLLNLLALRNIALFSGNLKWNGNHFDDKTQTVEQKSNCAFTEKGVVISLKLRQIHLNFDLSKMSLVTLQKLSFRIFTDFHHENFVGFFCIGSGLTLPWESPTATIQ